MARLSSFSEDTANIICSRLIEGESLRTICRDRDIPCLGTVCNWLAKGEELPDQHPEYKAFLNQYMRARELQADTIADEVLEIADNATNDYMAKHSKEGDNIGWDLNGEHVQRSRVRIDTRKWLAGKLKPKRYGDKQHLEHSGDKENPLAVAISDIMDRSKGLPSEDK